MASGESGEFPRLIPLFPLPDVVLFPGVLLPLHIFGPRYRAMVEDVERSADPLIGMTLLRGDWHKDYFGYPEIFATGCAGRIIDLVRLPDGRYNIVLSGVREFTVVTERRDRLYRQVVVEWRRETEPGLREEERLDLLQRGLALLRRLPHPPGWVSHLQDLPGHHLVNVLSFALPLQVLEKQALLEARSLQERAWRLREAIEFQMYEQQYSLEERSARDPH